MQKSLVAMFGVAIIIGFSALGYGLYVNMAMNDQISSLSESLRSQSAELRSSIKELQSSISQSQQAGIISAQQITTLQATIKNLEASLSSVNSQLNATKASNSASLLQISSQMQKINDDLNSELSKTKSSLINSGLQISVLESSLAESKAKISSLENSIAQEIAAREVSLAESKAKISSLTTQIDSILFQIKVISMPISDRHLNGTILKIQLCSECHGDVESLAATGQSNRYHNTHLNQSSRLYSFQCIDCHVSIDISSNSTELGRVVDVSVCKNCHTTFPSKSYMGNMLTPKDFALIFNNCLNCHDNWKSLMSKATYVKMNNIVGKDCVTCHLDKPLFSSEKPPVDIPCQKCH